jgi:septal ring factor EnvC (AmiA/AmiB activator)
MKFRELTMLARAVFIILAIAIVWTACGEKAPQQEVPQQVAESTQPEAKTQAQAATPTMASETEQMTKEIGTLYVELKRREAELQAKEQALQQLQRELDAKNAALADKDSQLQVLETRLAEREASLKTQKIIAYSGLIIGAIMFLVGYFSLRAAKKQKAKSDSQEPSKSAQA